MRRMHAVLIVVLLLASAAALRAQATTIRQYQLERGANGLQLALKTVPRPVAGPGQVLVRVRAVSLNQRDLLVLRGQYGPGGADMHGHVPLSDGAGEVIAVGTGAARFRVGDRVAGIFFTRWIEGKRHAEVAASARGGGGVDGMLSEVIAAHQDSLVRIPDHLTFEEAATLPCAGVTAYRALFVEGGLTRGDFVLLEGTGGALVVHGLAHGITRRFGRAGYGVVAPWIHEGLACWLDGEIQPKGANCCQSMDKRGGWEAREKWAELLKAAVTSGQDPPLADIVKAADVDALGGAGLAKAAAVLGWIGARADGTLWDLVAAASALGGEKGIARVLGKPVAEVDAEWRTSVKK